MCVLIYISALFNDMHISSHLYFTLLRLCEFTCTDVNIIIYFNFHTLHTFVFSIIICLLYCYRYIFIILTYFILFYLYLIYVFILTHDPYEDKLYTFYKVIVNKERLLLLLLLLLL